MPVLELSKAAVKRKVLALAAKMSSDKVNSRINDLLCEWQKRQNTGMSCDELELELTCWSEVWLRR